MAITITDNADEYMRDLEQQVPRRKTHVLVHSNNVRYAEHLHNREGFFVYNDEHMLATVDKHLERLTELGPFMTDAHIETALEASGFEEVDWLRSLTSELRPPRGARTMGNRTYLGRRFQNIVTTYKNAEGKVVAYDEMINGRLVTRTGKPRRRPRVEGPRRAHPGHWADDTGRLARGYVFSVNGKRRSNQGAPAAGQAEA